MRASLGQNFLTDENIARRIVESADLSFSDNVLEIGSGKGILTKYLAEKAGGVLAIEIDKEIINFLLKTLQKQFLSKPYHKSGVGININMVSEVGNVRIIEDDILKINLPKLIEENDFQDYKVVANLPYYITSKIIRLLLETKYPPSEMTLMVQKEVGERICAVDKKESILSISVKFYAEPEILFSVPKENFNPTPEVDSAVIRIKRKESLLDIYPVKSRKTGSRQGGTFNGARFFSLVRAGFSSKRKMLVNNLSSRFHIPKTKIAALMKKAGLEPTVRAEKLGVEDWIRLYLELKLKI